MNLFAEQQEKGMATHFSILAWRIPWTEEPDGLQFMGSQRVTKTAVSKYVHEFFDTLPFKRWSFISIPLLVG